jgi:hypothetical protein
MERTMQKVVDAAVVVVALCAAVAFVVAAFYSLAFLMGMMTA